MATSRSDAQAQIDVRSDGSEFKIDGVGVTATADELNALADTGLSQAELDFLDGATAGTQVASKAVIADANVNTGVSKVTELHIGVSGSETQVTSTAAELNILDGVTATAAELNECDDITSFTQSTIAVAAEGGDSIDVTVTLKDAAGSAVNEARFVRCWLSGSATTGAIHTDDGITVTASTGSLLVEDVDDLVFQAVTSTAGVLVLNVAGAGDLNPCYLWVQMPNGKSLVSAAIDLAA